MMRPEETVKGHYDTVLSVLALPVRRRGQPSSVQMWYITYPAPSLNAGACPPPRPGTWQKACRQCQRFLISSWMFDFHLMMLSSLDSINKPYGMSSPFQAHQDVTDTSKSISERIRRTKDTPTPTISPPHGKGVRIAGCPSANRFTSTFSRSCLTTEQATVPAWPCLGAIMSI